MPPTDRRLLRDTRAARRPFAAAAALGVATAATVIAQAVLLAEVIDRVAMHDAALADVRGRLLALAGVIAARALLAGLFDLSGRLGAIRVMSELRRRLAQRLLVERPHARPERTGELTAVAVQGVDALQAWFAGYLPQLVLATIIPPAILLWVGTVDLTATAVLAVTVPLVPLFMILIGLGARARTRSRWRALSLLSAHFLDVVRGLPTLRAFRREAAQERTIAAVSDRLRGETMRTLRIAFLSALVLELLAMLGTALVAATVGIQLANGHLRLEQGLVVLLLAPELYLPLRMVGQQFHAGADGTAAAEAIFAVLDGDGGAPARQAAAPAPDPAREPVRVEDVSFAYPGRGPVLQSVDLTLEPGRVTALVGPSGCGKSTLAALLLGLASPDGGRIRCGAVDLAEIDPAAWRARVAWVPQRARLFAGSIADNIRLADPHADDERVAAAARAAGVLQFAAELPEGLATVVGDGGRALSAGQTQRIAVARAFLADRPLLVLDEPTAHLDPATAGAIGDALERLSAGRTTLLVAHDAALAARADRVVSLAGGRAAELEPAPVISGAADAVLPGSPDHPGPRPAPAAPADAPAPWGALRRAAALAKPRRRGLALSIALSVGAVACAIGLLTTSGWLISRAAQRPPILMLTVAIVSVRAFGIGRAVLRYGERLSSHDVAFRLLADLRVRFFTRLAPLVPAGLPRMRRSDLLTRFVADVDALQDLYLRAIGPPIVAAVVVVLAGGVALAVLPVAALAIVLVLVAGGTGIAALTGAAARAAGRNQAGARAQLTGELTEAIDGAPELAVAGRGPERVDRVRGADARLARVARRDALASALAAGGTSLLPGAAALAVLVVAIPAVHGGRLPGVWLAALAFLGMAACEAVTPLPAAARALRGCAQAAARIEQVTAAPAPVTDLPQPRRPSGLGELRLDDVRLRYADGPLVLDGAELSVAPGEAVALVGPSGAGKTTIAELLVRFRDPQGGRVLLDGIDARELAQDDLRAAVLLAGQDAHLFTTTLRENVRLGRSAASDDELRAVLARVGLGEWLAALPAGLDTLVGEEGSSVSGGQRRRIAIARALLAAPRFLVLDEPTAHLDSAGARALLVDLLGAAGDVGVLVITHDRASLDLFDRVLELRAGRVIEQGSHRVIAAA